MGRISIARWTTSARSSFPSREIDNELRQMKDQERELNRFLNNLIGSPKSEKRKRALAGEPSPIVKQINALLESIDTNRKSIQNPGADTDQRSALEAYRSESQGTWEEINKLRAVIEIPQQLKDVKAQLKFATAQVNPTPRKDGSFGPVPFEKAANFFGVDFKALQSAVAEKAQIVSDIESAVTNGDAETAQSLMQESIHNGWHPGDLRGLLDMMKGSVSTDKGDSGQRAPRAAHRDYRSDRRVDECRRVPRGARSHGAGEP